MATKIIQMQEKTATGSNDLVPARVVTAESAILAQHANDVNYADKAGQVSYGTYASTDTSKGTIEQRLTNLGL